MVPLPRVSRRVAIRTVLPFERSGARFAEGHAPEVGAGRDEFQPEEFLSVAAFARGHHFALHRLAGVFVQQNDRLVRSDFGIERQQATELTYRVGVRANDELFAGNRLAVDAQRHRQGHARRTTPFDSPIVRDLHVRANTRQGAAGKGLSSVPCNTNVTTFGEF
jgi:hypothetical protein